uniref:Uncharacterized protein n=1 Tax=Parascaris univalens TaxID=6257 RepID=A0A915C3R1_PARUN
LRVDPVRNGVVMAGDLSHYNRRLKRCDLERYSLFLTALTTLSFAFYMTMVSMTSSFTFFRFQTDASLIRKQWQSRNLSYVSSIHSSALLTTSTPCRRLVPWSLGERVPRLCYSACCTVSERNKQFAS